MRRQAAVFCAIAFGLLWGAGQASADTIEQVEKAIVEKSKKIKSGTATMRSVTEMAAEGFKSKSVSEGKFEMLRKDGKVLTRIEMKGTATTEIAGKTDKQESTSLIISDGEYSYAYTQAAGQKTAYKMKATDEWNEDPFEPLRKMYDLKLLPDEKVDGAEVYVIEAKPNKTSGAPGVGKSIFYYRKDSGFPAKVVTCDEAGKPTTTITYADIKLDADLKADRFVFKAPEGVEVIDMSKMNLPGSQGAEGGAKKEGRPGKADSEKPKKPDEPKKPAPKKP